MMARPRRCRIRRTRPPWRDQNCPPGICTRCEHAEVWPDRPAAREQRRTERAAAGSIGAIVYDPLAVLADARVIGRRGSEFRSEGSR